MASPSSSAPETRRSAESGLYSPPPPPSNPRESQRERGCIVVVDDAFQRYVLPWELVKEWASFKSTIKDIYSRKRSQHLKEIEEDKFDVKQADAPGFDGGIVLPAVWNSAVRPGDTVKIVPWSSQELRHAKPRSLSDLDEDYPDVWRERAPPPVTRRLSRNPEDSDIEPDDADFTALPVGDEDSDIEDIDEIELSEESDDESESEPAPPPEPMRVVQPPIDDEGNELSFVVNTGWVKPSHNTGKETGSNSDVSGKPRDRPIMNAENFRITKAMSVTTEGRTTIQIHTLPGPESSAFSSDIHIRWYHLYAQYLDWAQFKSTCFAVPGLPDHVQKVLTKLFVRIEKDKLKACLGGMFIEPGTVLRADESDENDPQSVIFSCIPYFDLQKTSKSTPGRNDRLHPSRTLMQAYYPYEPVQDRDDEQAFRKFGNARGDSLVHVPSMWILNIGSYAVVTCGYRPLSTEFVKSIEVVPDDLKQLSSDAGGHKSTAIRLTDWTNHVLIYQSQECQTYFEMERKLRELKFLGGKHANSIQLFANTPQGIKKVKPAVWVRLISQRNTLFIDLFVSDEPKHKEIDQELSLDDLQPLGLSTLAQSSSVPPFFQWPTAKNEENLPAGFISMDTKQSTRCLELVEKAMFDEGLLKNDTIGVVDETFTSSKYYEELPEVQFEDFFSSLKPRLQAAESWEERNTHGSSHQKIVGQRCSEVAHETQEFVGVVQATLKLFVSDMDKSSLLRKLWGAMLNLVSVVERTTKRRAREIDPREYSASEKKPSAYGKRSWWIRSPEKGKDEKALPIPEGKENFAEMVRKCRRCRRSFKDPNLAIKHLANVHLGNDAEVYDLANPHYSPNARDTAVLREWICNEEQRLLELTVLGAATLLSQATEDARGLFKSIQEIADGARNQDGVLSPIYTFPRKLLDTLHQLVIFYLSVERSLHYYEERGIPDTGSRLPWEDGPEEHLRRDAAILRRFSEGVKVPLMRVREDLCDMARSTTPKAIEERLSLGPEYICSWLMRKLIVKPLDKSMSVTDMYREYLSTIQFQVNHRPGKRLLRSIKLVQEEIMILSTVTSWQARLVANYKRVLDDTSYPAHISFREAMFPFEQSLLDSCSESLTFTSEELTDQFRRCGPLSDSTKQSAEINEEDHGKAIFVFTVVTSIFLPLSFVTSYLGMNTSDIRDMESGQSLFWAIAAPLTVVVMVTVLFIAYNGDELRDLISSGYRVLTGKQARDVSARGISVIQRKRAAQTPSLSDSSSLADSSKGLADEAEYATPHPAHADTRFFHDDKGCNCFHTPDTTFYNAISPPYDTVPNPRRQDKLAFIPGVRPGITVRRSPVNTRSKLAIPENYTEPAAYDDRTRPATTIYNPPPPLPKYGLSSPLPPAPPPVQPPPHRHQAPYDLRTPQLRIHRTYLSPETLAHYAINYTLDPKDANYVVVKQNLDEPSLQVLYEHTRMLREIDRARSRPAQRGGYRGRYARDDDEDVWYGERRGRYDRGAGAGGEQDGGGYVWVKKHGKHGHADREKDRDAGFKFGTSRPGRR